MVVIEWFMEDWMDFCLLVIRPNGGSVVDGWKILMVIRVVVD